MSRSKSAPEKGKTENSSLQLTKREKAALEKAGRAAEADAREKGFTDPDEYFKAQGLRKIN